MLDADSLFERLLREAANLVPKMSTPKLTYALKVTSSLQQKITDTVASRLPQEKSTEQLVDSSRQQIHLESVLSQGGLHEAALIASDSDQIRRTALNQLDGNYGGFTIFPQLNHIGRLCE
ncbi:zinc finger protein [Schistosoma japonicum]|nr:zinc finger protein [Schistosoma japonicum]